MLEAECKYMPRSTKRFGKVVKQASVAEQQCTRGCKKQTNVLLKARVMPKLSK